jgi:hypothetical protein
MFRRTAILCLVSTLLWGMTGTAAFAGPEAQASVSTPPLTYKTYAGVGFSPISSAYQYSIDDSEIYTTSSTAEAKPFILPLDLPQGAEIYSINYYVIDNSDTSDIQCMVGRYNPQDDAWLLGYGGGTSGASANIQTLTFSYPDAPFLTVDNAKFFYFLRIDLTDPYSQAITGARIGYTLPSPPTGAQTITLGGYAFQPETSSMKYAPYGDKIFLTQNDLNHSLAARLNLPIGTQITGLTYYVIDNDANAFMTLGMMGAPVDGGMIAPYETYSGGPNSAIQPYTVPVPATVSAGSSYTLYVRFSAVSNNLILAGARLTYTLPNDPPFRTTSTFAGMTFHPDSSSIGYSSYTGALFQTSADSNMGFSAPLDLPQGSHITRATCYALDYDAAISHVLECSLAAYYPAAAYRYDLYAANTSSPASSSSIRALKMIDPTKNGPVVVDNGYYQYRVLVNFDVATDANVKLVAVVVETGHQLFLPVLYH